ncbi:hypothetical protein CP061683_0622, partial [Chlamydia psittaci 06-1683]
MSIYTRNNVSLISPFKQG